jgi:hypothetical protein
MGTVCAFCGASPTTREHILPRWLQKYFPDKVLEHSRSSGGVSVNVWDAGAFTATSRIACASCNNGWMSRLERHAEPFVSALALGHRISLDPFLQPIVATWAYKTALVFETAQATDSARLSEKEYVDFGSAMLPPPEASIYVGKYDWVPNDYVGRFLSRIDRNHPTSTGEPTDATVYKATLTLGAALFNVAIAWAGDGTRRVVEMQFPSGTMDKLRRIWRLDFSFDWPPAGAAFTEEEFIEMSIVTQSGGV